MSLHRPVCMVPKKTSLWGRSEHTEGSMNHWVTFVCYSGCVFAPIVYAIRHRQHVIGWMERGKWCNSFTSSSILESAWAVAYHNSVDIMPYINGCSDYHVCGGMGKVQGISLMGVSAIGVYWGTN